MAASADFSAYVAELFASLGALSFKKMFGVVGVYADELMFAIIAQDVLYLRVDEASEAAFRAAGSEPFVYHEKDGREVAMSYWRAPDEALEGPDEAAPWGRMAVDATARKRASKPKRSSARRPSRR